MPACLLFFLSRPLPFSRHNVVADDSMYQQTSSASYILVSRRRDKIELRSKSSTNWTDWWRLVVTATVPLLFFYFCHHFSARSWKNVLKSNEMRGKERLMQRRGGGTQTQTKIIIKKKRRKKPSWAGQCKGKDDQEEEEAEKKKSVSGKQHIWPKTRPDRKT